MIFEKAINDAPNMFLFDRRSQQQLQEMAEEASPGSKDRFLIRMTHAAFTYYNDFESQGWDIRGSIRQAQAILRDVKRYRGDRIFYTLALRMEVDILLHQSRLNYQDAPSTEKVENLYNEEDARALSICDTLLKNFPPNIEPLPNSWFTSLIPLVPSFQQEVMRFYADRVKENRIIVLQTILRKIKAELMMASAIVLAKRFLSETKFDPSKTNAVYNLLLSSVREVMSRLDGRVPTAFQVVSDVSLPRGISQGQIEIAVQNVQGEINKATTEKDMRKYTASLLQLGILNFLRNNAGNTIKALVNTLRASKNLDPEFKKVRQYRHDTFADIPFMIGTAFLRMNLDREEDEEEDDEHDAQLGQSRMGLFRAVALNPSYHQAYVNLALALSVASEPGLDELVEIYLRHFDRDIAQLDGHLFRNLSAHEYRQNGEYANAAALKWLIISYFSVGGELTKGKKMLQELKTLYILNAHEFSSSFITAYRSAFRQGDPEFIADLEDDYVHSAVLFYIAHGFASRALSQNKNQTELNVSHEHLDQSIELNAEALYFNSENSSALRLVQTQISILQFAIRRTEKRWEHISSNMSNRFEFYEDYLRELKSAEKLKERLGSVNMEEAVPAFKLSETAVLRMDLNLTEEQRDRIKNRVNMS